MKGVAAVITPVVFFAACAANEKEACGGSDAKFHDEGLIFHLSRAGVPHRRMHGGGLCVAERHASQLRAAERELDRYFPQIAHKPRDSCEERALNREKLDKAAPTGATCKA